MRRLAITILLSALALSCELFQELPANDPLCTGPFGQTSLKAINDY